MELLDTFAANSKLPLVNLSSSPVLTDLLATLKGFVTGNPSNAALQATFVAPPLACQNARMGLPVVQWDFATLQTVVNQVLRVVQDLIHVKMEVPAILSAIVIGNRLNVAHQATFAAPPLASQNARMDLPADQWDFATPQNVVNRAKLVVQAPIHVRMGVPVILSAIARTPRRLNVVLQVILAAPSAPCHHVRMALSATHLAIVNGNML